VIGHLTWSDAFALAAAVAGIGSLLHGVELVAIRQELAVGGLLSWNVLRTSHPALLRSPLAQFADRLLAPPAFLLLIAVQIVGSLLIVARPSDPPIWALASVIAIRSLCNFRNSPAIMGADQMQVIVLVACLVYAVAPEPMLAYACGWFVCLQLVLAYVTAGVAKVVSPAWRSGTAVTQIVRSRTVGLQRAYEYTRRFPALALVLAWATIAFEIGCPWLVFGGSSAAAVFLATGVLFHIGVAIVMGLDEFFWAYVAAYPIALRCSMVFG
jgi:hypothetical protein